MDQDTALHPLPRPVQCSCGVALSRFTVTGIGNTRQIELTPAPAELQPPLSGTVVAWALSSDAFADWCAGRPPIHDIVDDQGRRMSRRDHAAPVGTRLTCAACGTPDQPYLHEGALCDACTAYVPLVLEFHDYTARGSNGGRAPHGPSPAQQLNAVLLDYAIPPSDVSHLLPGAATTTNGIAHSSLIALLRVPRHIAGHILHSLSDPPG